MRILIAAGGTGGHIFPALAVADAIKEIDSSADITFVGVGRPIESQLVPAAGYPLECIPFVPITGRGALGLLRFALKLPLGLMRGIGLFRKTKAEVVIGFGGFPSFVPMFSGWILRKRVLLHEQNVQVGLANRILSRISSRVFAPYGVRGFQNSVAVEEAPNPVRKAFVELGKKERSFNAPLRLLITGGSQGAVSLNDAAVELIPLFKELQLEVTHQAGQRDEERIAKAYSDAGFPEAKVCGFLDPMHEAYEKADIVICRAGAMTAAEVSASGLPAIYVPLSIAGGHQLENIRRLVNSGAAVVCEHGDGLVEELSAELKRLAQDPQAREQMSQKALELSSSKGVSAAEQIARAVCQK